MDEQSSTLGAFPTRVIRALDLSPLHIFRAGHEAVILFFVLSGFVLAKTSGQLSLRNYFAYLAKRALRIYPAYWATVGIAFLAFLLFGTHSHAQLTQWFSRHWNAPLTMSVAVDHLVLLGSFENYKFNTVTWSLVEEMRISIIFPFLALMVGWIPWRRLAVLFVGLSVVGCFISYRLHQLGAVFDYPSTLHYAFFFWLGATIYRHRSALTSRYVALRSGLRLGLVLLAVLVYGYGRALNHVPHHGFIKELPFADWAIGFASATIILAVLAEPMLRALLAAPILVKVGQCSYSLYLIHAVVLMTLVHAFGTLLPPLGIVPFVAPIAFGLALLLYRYVEAPSIILGRRLSEWIKTDRPLPRSFAGTPISVSDPIRESDRH